MRRLSSKPDQDVRKGAWTEEEDNKLRAYVEANGTGHWRSVGKRAGRPPMLLLLLLLSSSSIMLSH